MSFGCAIDAPTAPPLGRMRKKKVNAMRKISAMKKLGDDMPARYTARIPVSAELNRGLGLRVHDLRGILRFQTGSALLPLSVSVEALDLTKTTNKSAVSVLSTQVDLAT